MESYIQNSRAIYDSLLRYQDAKTALHLKTTQVTSFQTQLIGCQVQSSKLRTDANDMAARLHAANTSYDHLHRRFRRAQLERWAWRIGAALTLYFVLK
ncbi:hypothetical protein P1X15_10055 [Runella sp. MFBS21]|uniref:hypothetical protein n=1 Tax=Runella sp. MFBS21 TaxID=3034018 RepID=UPI0023F8621C|nr:hypothetical protein [Runella sp. MFBS21]MDF7817941.1 hypothetical protein [Runella sp. MFBS21]